jgi:hypothetical protein
MIRSLRSVTKSSALLQRKLPRFISWCSKTMQPSQGRRFDAAETPGHAWRPVSGGLLKAACRAARRPTPSREHRRLPHERRMSLPAVGFVGASELQLPWGPRLVSSRLCTISSRDQAQTALGFKNLVTIRTWLSALMQIAHRRCLARNDPAIKRSHGSIDFANYPVSLIAHEQT